MSDLKLNYEKMMHPHFVIHRKTYADLTIKAKQEMQKKLMATWNGSREVYMTPPLVYSKSLIPSERS